MEAAAFESTLAAVVKSVAAAAAAAAVAAAVAVATVAVASPAAEAAAAAAVAAALAAEAAPAADVGPAAVAAAAAVPAATAAVAPVPGPVVDPASSEVPWAEGEPGWRQRRRSALAFWADAAWAQVAEVTVDFQARLMLSRQFCERLRLAGLALLRSVPAEAGLGTAGESARAPAVALGAVSLSRHQLSAWLALTPLLRAEAKPTAAAETAASSHFLAALAAIAAMQC